MELTLESVLKTEMHTRLSIGNRWLVWDEVVESWMVFEKKPYKKSSEVLFCGERLQEALEILIKEN